MDFEIVRIPWYIKLADYFHDRVIVPVRTPTGTPYYERTWLLYIILCFEDFIVLLPNLPFFYKVTSDEIRYYFDPFLIKLLVFLYDFILLLIGTIVVIHNYRNVTQGEFSKINLLVIPIFPLFVIITFLQSAYDRNEQYTILIGFAMMVDGLEALSGLCEISFGYNVYFRLILLIAILIFLLTLYNASFTYSTFALLVPYTLFSLRNKGIQRQFSVEVVTHYLGLYFAPILAPVLIFVVYVMTILGVMYLIYSSLMMMVERFCPCCLNCYFCCYNSSDE